MAEPTTTTAGAITAYAAGISSVTLALIGVDPIAIIWGLIGAMFARGHGLALTRARAGMYIAITTFSGAALGTGFESLFQNIMQTTHQTRPLLVLASLIGGAFASRLIEALGTAIERKLSNIGGEK
jgi:hypothetical protein